MSAERDDLYERIRSEILMDLPLHELSNDQLYEAIETRFEDIQENTYFSWKQPITIYLNSDKTYFK